MRAWMTTAQKKEGYRGQDPDLSVPPPLSVFASVFASVLASVFASLFVSLFVSPNSSLYRSLSSWSCWSKAGIAAPDMMVYEHVHSMPMPMMSPMLTLLLLLVLIPKLMVMPMMAELVRADVLVVVILMGRQTLPDQESGYRTLISI